MGIKPNVWKRNYYTDTWRCCPLGLQYLCLRFRHTRHGSIHNIIFDKRSRQQGGKGIKYPKVGFFFIPPVLIGTFFITLFMYCYCFLLSFPMNVLSFIFFLCHSFHDCSSSINYCTIRDKFPSIRDHQLYVWNSLFWWYWWSSSGFFCFLFSFQILYCCSVLLILHWFYTFITPCKIKRG